MNAGSGVVYLYTYNGEGYVTAEKVKRGSGGTAYYLRSTWYGSGSVANQPKHLPVASYEYPDSEVTAEISSTDARTTKYEYEFYPSDDEQEAEQKLKKRIITHPVVAAGENGSGVAIQTKEYYDSRGQLRWTQDGEGHVSYYSYDKSTGGLGYSLIDVETDNLPPSVTDPTKSWLPWDTQVDGAPPFAHEDAGLAIATKYIYDDLGRLVRSEDANGTFTAVAYWEDAEGNSEVRTYPGWRYDSQQECYVVTLPIRVTKTNDDDLTTETYRLDPAGVTLGVMSGSYLPSGNDSGQGREDYITWTRYGYNAVTAMLESVDVYHQIPSSGPGTLSTNYARTFYRYDGQGRRTHVIEVASGTNPTSNTVEQVTQTYFDQLDRVTSVMHGVSLTGHSMGADYGEDPTLEKISETFYDQATAGSGASGVGDGLVACTLSYYDTSETEANAVKTIYHYNWRGHLRGIEPETAPFTVMDVDNLGRTTAAAQFISEPSWPTGTDVYAAATTSGRRSLSKTLYDVMGRVYRTETYSVASTGQTPGVLGSKLTTDRYYDRNSRLVATASPASGGTEMGYDAAGRLIETRSVVELKSTKYTNGVFNYCNPQPEGTGGDEGVLAISRVVLDKVGNVLESVQYEATHVNPDGSANANGLSLSGSGTSRDYICTAGFSWYDDVHRLTAQAAYGTSTDGWKPNDKPTRSKICAREERRGRHGWERSADYLRL